MKTSVRSRILGLDVARSLAILMVLGAHFSFFWLSLDILTPKITAVSIVLGSLGVELFFVLSGFLIGGLLLRDMLQPSVQKINVFFLRRWLRTLPAYYAVLLILSFIDFIILGKGIRFEYIIFIQNFENGANDFFPVSWTLAIEQWAYIVAPVVIFVIPKLIIKIKSMPLEHALFLSLGFVLLFFLFIRIAVVFTGEPTWDTDIRKQILLRLDAIFFGITIFCIKKFIPRLYGIFRTTLCFICMSIILILYALSLYESAAYNYIDTSFFHRTFGFSVCDLMMALILPFFDQNRIPNIYLSRNKKIASFFYWTSEHAYSIYLVHFSIFFLAYKICSFMRGFFGIQELATDSFYTFFVIIAWIMMVFITITVTVSVSQLLFRVIERPCMDLRRFIHNPSS